MNTLDDFNNYIKKLIPDNFDRYGITFETISNKYFFDTGTGKVLQCSDKVYQLLYELIKGKGRISSCNINMTKRELKEAISDIKSAIEHENILKALPMKSFNCTHTNNIEKYVGITCEQLILEVTERCNLRCRYCIYEDETENFRNFGMKDMDTNTALKAIDYALSLSGEKFTLSFYGGEPLLNFPLIKKCIEYYDSHYTGEKNIVITSNLTRITKDIAHFFALYHVNITCSLDGAKKYHDYNRPYANGQGSFEDTIRGLRCLIDAYTPSDYEKISINTVISPPYTNVKYNEIQAFYESLNWLPKDIYIKMSYVSRDEYDENINLKPNIELINSGYNFTDSFTDWIMSRIVENKDIFSDDQLKASLLYIHERKISNQPIDDGYFNACCLPGFKRLYVTTSGNFSPCERIGTCPTMGNVNTGLDIEAIKKYYVKEYANQSIENCSNCWARRLCNVCYAKCYTNDGIDMKRKKVLCERSRFNAYNSLIRYHIMLEKCPEKLKNLVKEPLL